MISRLSAHRIPVFFAALALGACATLSDNTMAPSRFPPPAVAPDAPPSDELAGPRFGGPGGSGSEVRCPFANGIQGQSGSLLDRIGLVCFTEDNAWETPSYGGSGGARSVHLCPPGARAIGIFGRGGTYIDRLGLLCSNSEGQRSKSESLGGTGGQPFEWECPAGQALIGLDLMSGDYVDSVAAVCARR